MNERNDPRSTADAYLELLVNRGVEYLFGNAGTDFGPIIDAYARRTAEGQPVPRPIAVTHEITAMAMAHGYGMVSGRTPAIMVHTVAGTANSIGGLINANRAQVPMLFTAGRTPITETGTLGARDIHIHWAQESFDQGGMAREWVKWDYELRPGADLAGVVDRALAIARSEPAGPVYLTLPREVLAAPHNGTPIDGDPAMVAGQSVASADAVTTAAAALAAAENPIIITRSLGRDPTAVEELVRLAATIGAPVFDPYPTHANLDFDHPLHLIRSPEPFLAEADVVIVVESDVPWIPQRANPRPDCTVIGIGSDPLHGRYPIRGFRVDLNLAGNAGRSLRALTEALRSVFDGELRSVLDGELRSVFDGELRSVFDGELRSVLDGEAVARRTAAWTDIGGRDRRAAEAAAQAGAAAKPLEKPWFSACLNEMLPDDSIVVDELGCDVTQLGLRAPGSFYGVSQAGVLGWSLGAGLGAKLAAPDRTVVSVMGDGSYLFGVPTTAHWVSRRYDLPVLNLVWNNAKWGAVEGATRMVYPDGWAARTDSFPFSELQPCIDYEMVCQAAGGHGERVEDPADLPDALERALKTVAGGRQALLNLIAHP